MWRVFLTLALASACLAMPSPQQNNGKLDSLLPNVLGPAPIAVPNAAPQAQIAPAAFSKVTGKPNLDALLSSIYWNQYSTTTTTYLGTQNNPRPKDCECVPYYLCHNKTIIVDGIGILDIKINACEHHLEVCCKPPDMMTIPSTPPPLASTPPPLESTPPPLEKGCGNRNPGGIGFRITGNTKNEAQFAEFPWMVAIFKEDTIHGKNISRLAYQCGGSLIHRQAVLTAAHCVYGKQPSELRIRAGEWDTQTKYEIYPHQDRGIRSVIVHEKYYAGPLFFDFAILILSEPVNEAENIGVVCLPEQNAVYDGSRCFASGWGKDTFGKEGLYQVILKKVHLPIVPRDTCQDRLRKTRLGKYFILHESFICAGEERGKGTCKGDGGSPLVCPSESDPTRYQQAGIVAWGIGCGEDGNPGVYANVAHVRDWIDEQMTYNTLDTVVYKL